MKQANWLRLTVLALVVTLAASPAALADYAPGTADIVPILAPVLVPDPSLSEARTALEAYYTVTEPESWEDFLAAALLGVLPENAAIQTTWSQATQILCALAAGRDPYALRGGSPYELAATQQADGSFGMSLGEHVYAMLALERAPARNYRRAEAEAYLLSLQRDDGSFEAWGSVTEPTGLALLVLEGQPAERAVTFLHTQMTQNGGFVGYPDYETQEDACTTATVINGLLAAGADIPPNTITHLLGYRDESGLFAWKQGMEADTLFATPQCALVVAQLTGGHAMFHGLPAFTPEDAPPFSDWADVPDWARGGVRFAADSGLMNGDALARFLPEQTVTRAELAMLLKLMGLSHGQYDADSYADVQLGDWFADAVRYAGENGLIQGQDGLFGPHEPLTREELAFILARALDLTVTGTETAPSDLQTVLPEYADAVRAMFAEGLMIGDGTRFRPKGQLTRMEMATLLKKLYD